MILALSLALAQAAAPSTADVAAIVARSNRVMYDLPEAVATFDCPTDPDAAVAGKVKIRAARRGANVHFTFVEYDRLMRERFSDGKRSFILNHGQGTYVEQAAEPRPDAEKALVALPPLDHDDLRVFFNTSKGLELRSRPAFDVVRDEPSAGPKGLRRLTLRSVQAGDDRTPGGERTRVRIEIDATGLIRRVEAEDWRAPGLEPLVKFTCDPFVPKTEPFAPKPEVLARMRPTIG